MLTWYWVRGGWRGPESLGVPIGTLFRPGSTVSAVGWLPDHTFVKRMDLYAVGVDGKIYTRTWLKGSGWEQNWVLIAQPPFSGASLVTASLCYPPGNNQIYTVAPNGDTYTNTYSYRWP